MAEKIFLSYAYQDREFAETLSPRLAEILSLRAVEIVDIYDHIAPDSDLRKTIKEAMKDSSTVVIVSSPDGDASDVVNYEAGLADALEKEMVIVERPGTRRGALIAYFAERARVIALDGANLRPVRG